MKLIDGYDYILHRAVSLSRAEWQERIAKCIKAGGFRRVEAGETFLHEQHGRMTAEIYANVPAATKQSELPL